MRRKSPDIGNQHEMTHLAHGSTAALHTANTSSTSVRIGHQSADSKDGGQQGVIVEQNIIVSVAGRAVWMRTVTDSALRANLMKALRALISSFVPRCRVPMKTML